ncbi:MAG TPA: DUF4136 domain-containing protein [Croceibacterium sp.]|nr:DUF4136 domain-containing protein [Croceibacterium sp.]
MIAERTARLKAVVASGIASVLMAGCAGNPGVSAMPIGRGVPEGAATFALAEPLDNVGRIAAPHVERKLRELGFEPSANPDLLVQVGGAERSRAVGAYIADPCDAATPAWVEQRGKGWLLGGGRVLTLTVRIIDAGTGAPVYQASSQRRMAGGFNDARIERLVDAALSLNPKEVAAPASPSC